MSGRRRVLVSFLPTKTTAKASYPRLTCPIGLCYPKSVGLRLGPPRRINTGPAGFAFLGLDKRPH